ncbi:MAG: peptidylprolyl isomerase [Moorea sp. SIO2B7]|nr:peptidylprolyl isomerase [Moorena sp. SIO2B7]
MIAVTENLVDTDDIIISLKKDIRLKDIYQKILRQKVIDKACKERNLTVTDEEIEAEANRCRYEMRLEKASDTLAWLEDQKISPDDWEAGIRDRLLSQKLCDCLFAKEVDKYFTQNRLDYEQVLLYQIIVPYENLARELFYQIEEEEISFYQAAHMYDIDERRKLICGYEGKVYRWKLQPDVAAVIFSSEIGEVTMPLKTELGHHLFLVEEFIAAELTPQRETEIKQKMFQQWLSSELNYMLHSEAA